MVQEIINECWRSINGFINYQVSNLGRIRNCNTGRILKACANSNGYLLVNLCKEGKQTSCNIHKLVANEFIENPDNKKCVDHISGDKYDNRVTNLRFATYSDNNRNKPKKQNTSSKYIGVSWCKTKKRWHCRVRDKDGKLTHLGYFKNEKDAGFAYNKYVSANFPEFGFLNQID